MNLAELTILDFIAAHLRTPVLDGFFSTITHFGDSGIGWMILAVVLLINPKTRRPGLCVAVALVLDLLLCNCLLKPLVARIRPYDLNPAAELLIAAPHDFSFPSGHTAASFAAVGALYACRCWVWKPAVAMATAVALSRPYLYIHYPTDILGGLLVGLACGFAGAALVRQLNRCIRRGKEQI